MPASRSCSLPVGASEASARAAPLAHGRARRATSLPSTRPAGRRASSRVGNAAGARRRRPGPALRTGGGGRRSPWPATAAVTACVAADLAAGHGLELPGLSERLGASSRRCCRRRRRRETRSTSPAEASRTSPASSAWSRRCSTRARSTRSSSPATSAATRSTRTSSSSRRCVAPRAMADAAEETGRPLVVAHDVLGGRPAGTLRERASRSSARSRPRSASLAASRGGRPRHCLASRRSPSRRAPVTGRDGLLRGPRAARGGRDPVRRSAAGRRRGRGARRRGRDRLPRRPEGARGCSTSRTQGGVALGLEDEAAERAYTDLMATASAPPAYSVEAMATVAGGVELIVGARRDPRFGPIALVGAGGLYAEILKDVAVALAPVTEAAAEALSGRCASRPSSTAPAAGRPWTSARRPGPPLRSPRSPPSTRRSPRSRSIRCSCSAGRRTRPRRADRPRRATMLAEGTFDGKVAIVTGGGSGLGRAMALEFARLGASVAVAGRRPEPLEETVAAPGPEGARRAHRRPRPRAGGRARGGHGRRVRPRRRPRQQRRRQLRRPGGGSLAERLARGRLHRPRRRLPLLPRGGRSR